METIFWYWNMVHYCIYLFFNNISNLMNYINPLYYFLKIPSVKRFYAKRNIDDMHGAIRNVVNNPSTGINSVQAFGLLGGLLVLLLMGIYNTCQLFFTVSISDWIFSNTTNSLEFLCFTIAPALLINYFVVFKEDRYLEYFKEFEKIDAHQIKKYYVISLITVIFIFSFFLVSFKFIK